MPLDADELALWHAFKRAGEAVRAAIGEEITRATGLSDPEFGIVTRLDDAGGRMRQQELAASMGWHRSRLSHQLTRMTDRGLVDRTGVGSGVDVVLTHAGRVAARRARPVHAAAVRRHLLAHLPDGLRDELLAVLTTLAGPP
ncbi:MarR family winged helix-turn-helix transcriptional regulator [Actinomycetospora chlora]|uniref:MarR family winged helix-turn-helix transcriptional regulator n=1 Tax=Actinomycetospora chlora TaxID=663608 RepID=A0ABP9BKB0_9PSEU